jgi:hypothetical protein
MTPGKSLTKLCTIPSANTWTLVTLPNIPVWPSTGTFGFYFGIVLAAGSSITNPVNDTWQNGNFLGVPGIDNFASKPVNSTFDIAFCQQEPGPLCTAPIDKPFVQNYQECLRYYHKSYDYNVAIGTSGNGEKWMHSDGAGFAMGSLPFPVLMAKTPNSQVYIAVSPFTAGSVVGWPTTSTYVISSIETSTKSIDYLQGSTIVVANGYRFQYTADTGW